MFCLHTLDPNLLKKDVELINISFPDLFIKVFTEERLWENSPVFKLARKGAGPVYWKKAQGVKGTSKKIIRRELTNDCALQGAVTISPFKPRIGQEFSMLNIGDPIEREFVRSQIILERLMPHFHHSLVDVFKGKKGKDEVIRPLSNREREVLYWVKEGKTSWEISVILRISERTINFHVGNIKSKLDVSSRTCAVAQAMHLGLIH